MGVLGKARFLSWLILFSLQLFFNIYKIVPFWIRVATLSSWMFLTSIFWIKHVEKTSLIKRLDIEEKGITFLTYIILTSLVIIFLSSPFSKALTLTGTISILPMFEELFFRVFLLGSMVNKNPYSNFKSFSKKHNIIKEFIFPLIVSSLLFALVHDDVIIPMLVCKFTIPSLTIFSMRVLFGVAIGDLYIFFSRRMTVPVASHLAFNLTYFVSSFF